MVETLKWLRKTRDDFANGLSGTAFDSLEKYQRMSTQAAEGLRFIFADADIEKLILTPRHWMLMSTVISGNAPTGLTHEAVSVPASDQII